MDDPAARRRTLTAGVLGLAAALLVPWIVVLWVVQDPRGTAHHLTVLSVGAVVAVAACLLLAAASVVARPRRAVVAATGGAVLALGTAWFHVVTRTASSGTGDAALGTVLLVLIALAGVGSAAVVHRPARPAASHPSAGVTAARVVLVVAALLLVVPAVRLAVVTPARAEVHHLKVAWVGLDVAECVALACTAWLVRRHRPGAVFAGAATAALLGLDAATNVVATSGAGRGAALAMCLVELPLAALALAAAHAAPAGRSG